MKNLLSGFVIGVLLGVVTLGVYTTINADNLNSTNPVSTQVVAQPTSLARVTAIPPTNVPIRPTIAQATIVVAPTTGAIPQTNVPITPNNAPNDIVFQELLASVNQLRSSLGVGALTVDARLNEAAAVQAEYNARIEALTHDGEFGASVAERVEAEGYLWSTVGENLLMNWQLDGVVAFEQWEDSPGHYANMVNPNYTQVGMAYVVKPTGQNYQAMVFGRPR